MSIYKGSEPALLGGSAVVDDAVTTYSTWSSQKIKNEIENGGAGLNKEVVVELPTDPRNISDRTIYMVPNGQTSGDDQYDKFMYIEGRWEKLNADKDAVKSGDFMQLLKDNTDDALSDTSEKPVQNKVVKEALDARYTKDEIDAKLSSTYKAAGSVANISALPAADAAHLGYVYNVEAAFTSTANFKEGAGKSYPAGSNVAIVLDGANYKYDVLAGFIDQSAFAPASHVSDTTKHITAAERTAWNGKVSSGDFIQLLKDNTDDELSDTSENPVQNKVVQAAFKQRGQVVSIPNDHPLIAPILVDNKVSLFDLVSALKPNAGDMWVAPVNNSKNFMVALNDTITISTIGVRDSDTHIFRILVADGDLTGVWNTVTIEVVNVSSEKSYLWRGRTRGDVSDRVVNIWGEASKLDFSVINSTQVSDIKNKLGVASTTNLGGVKVGTGLSAVADGTVSIDPASLTAAQVAALKSKLGIS